MAARDILDSSQLFEMKISILDELYHLKKDDCAWTLYLRIHS